MARESLDLIIQEDGRIVTEILTPHSKPLLDFFGSHGIRPDLVYEKYPSTSLYKKANDAHFRMTRRGDRYVFGLTTVLNAKTHYPWEVNECCYWDMVKKVFSSDTKLPTKEEVIAKARDRGYEPTDKDSAGLPYFTNFRDNGSDKNNWSYDFTNNRIKVIKAPEAPEQKEQP